MRLSGRGQSRPSRVHHLNRRPLDPQDVRALVLLVAFTSLRWGEAVALRRKDLDLESATVSVRLQQVELDTGELLTGPPKSRAGIRTVAFPAAITPVLQEHMNKFVGPEEEALIFTGSRGGTWRRSNFRRYSSWHEAARKIGVPGLHFHDLRHTGNHLAAGSGASLRDLMQRMGHDSVRAAMIYQHTTQEADWHIADAMNNKIKETGETSPG
jgi:integrase